MQLPITDTPTDDEIGSPDDVTPTDDEIGHGVVTLPTGRERLAYLLGAPVYSGYPRLPAMRPEQLPGTLDRPTVGFKTGWKRHQGRQRVACHEDDNVMLIISCTVGSSASSVEPRFGQQLLF